VSEISAAASSTNTFSILASYGTYEEHCSSFVHRSQASSRPMPEVVNGKLTRLTRPEGLEGRTGFEPGGRRASRT
jgi:hypothetical protein